MKLGERIRIRRQALGLTQEQLAQKLGVSAPAVNKWERNLNYPDITLLPALARALGVDLNTLLSFQEELTEGEIGEFLNRLYEASQTGGSGAAFALAEDKLREYPNSDQLAYSVAGILAGILALQPEEDGPERQGQEAEVTALYERCVRSADPQVREWATYTLASRCVNTGELERAEALLGQLSDTHREKQELTARLRWAQGRRQEAWVLVERELFNQAHAIQSTLLSMLDWALKEEDRERARVLADTAVRLSLTVRYGDLRRFDPAPVVPLLQRLFLRACLTLEDACRCDAKAAPAVTAAMDQLNRLQLDHDCLDGERWLELLRRVSDRDDLNTLCSGFAMAALLERGEADEALLAREISRRLSPGVPAELGAGWFEGLASKNRYALIARLSLWRHLDGYLSALDEGQFRRALVFLRRAFSGFTPAEKGDIAENLGEIWGVNRDQAAEALTGELTQSEQEALKGLEDFNFDDI